nr:hypothetical protein BaRGS_001337 [Batillaria attramentaria]
MADEDVLHLSIRRHSIVNTFSCFLSRLCLRNIFNGFSWSGHLLCAMLFSCFFQEWQWFSDGRRRVGVRYFLCWLCLKLLTAQDILCLFVVGDDEFRSV